MTCVFRQPLTLNLIPLLLHVESKELPAVNHLIEVNVGSSFREV